MPRRTRRCKRSAKRTKRLRNSRKSHSFCELSYAQGLLSIADPYPPVLLRIREQRDQLDIVATRASEVLGTSGSKQGATTVTYVDFEKTADAYQRVKEYEETGKKRFQ